MKKLLMIFILLFAVSVIAQDSPQPDRWRGLVIDVTAPDEAIKVLGTPTEDKAADSFRVYKIDKWLTKGIRKKQYRRLEYKKIEGFDKVILAFAAGKLVFIELNPKKLSPNVLAKAYGVEFSPAFSKFDMALSPKNYERDAGKIEAKSYPSFYYLVAVAEKTFIVGSVSNSSLGSMLGSAAVNDDLTYPGKIEQLQIVSRSLENKENLDLLK